MTHIPTFLYGVKRINDSTQSVVPEVLYTSNTFKQQCLGSGHRCFYVNGINKSNASHIVTMFFLLFFQQVGHSESLRGSASSC